MRKFDVTIGKASSTVRGLFSLLLLATPGASLAADWNADRAAAYLDERQHLWSQFKIAQVAGGQCVSCHTGITYTLARQALRLAKANPVPTEYEDSIRSSLIARLSTPESSMFPSFRKEPLKTQASSVEAVIAAFVLSQMSNPDTAGRKNVDSAFDRLWSLQLKEGEGRGSWPWFHLQLDPWESKNSGYYGAALAAIAVGTAKEQPQRYPQEVAALKSLSDEQQGKATLAQPSHASVGFLSPPRPLDSE